MKYYKRNKKYLNSKKYKIQNCTKWPLRILQKKQGNNNKQKNKRIVKKNRRKYKNLQIKINKIYKLDLDNKM